MNEQSKTRNAGRRVHLIAIGGSAMHNLALELHYNGWRVSGSDDEIYEPSKSRLAAAGLLPEKTGWHPEKIDSEVDMVILGMHARADNPELRRAKELGIPVLSYPEFIYQVAENQLRVVVAGSHGKTSTTAMILHVLRHCGISADYLVGAQLQGFDRMVKLSNAPYMVLEGDEYLASALMPFPKIHFYKPNIAIITGIAWDHVNVFPTFENYIEQFSIFIEKMDLDTTVFYYERDLILKKIVKNSTKKLKFIGYDTHPYQIIDGITHLVTEKGESVPLQIFGAHNLQNLNAARLVCEAMGVSKEIFYEAIRGFGGAAKRLEKVLETANGSCFNDFAHAPSKVEATINAVKTQYAEKILVACLELHTFSSLNKDFLVNYAETMRMADIAFVFYSQHTLEMKKMLNITPKDVAIFFKHPNLMVVTEKKELVENLKKINWSNTNLLMMSSGNFDKLNVKDLAATLLNE